MEVPGFPGYTVDTNLTVRTYKRNEPKEMTVQSNGNVPLVKEGARYQFSPAKLKYCAEHNIVPTEIDGDQFIITKDGKVVFRDEFIGTGTPYRDKNMLPVEGFRSKRKAQKALRLLTMGLTAQRKTLRESNPLYIADFLKENKELIISHIRKYMSLKREVGELDRRFDELAALVADKYYKNFIVKASLHISAAREMATLIKEEKENPKKIDYEKVEYAMTESGMYKQ